VRVHADDRPGAVSAAVRSVRVGAIISAVEVAARVKPHTRNPGRTER
jgi:hypothetical protein